MTASAQLNRRHLFVLLGGLLALPMAARGNAHAVHSSDEIVIVDGWVLRASDLKMAVLDAA